MSRVCATFLDSVDCVKVIVVSRTSPVYRSKRCTNFQETSVSNRVASVAEDGPHIDQNMTVYLDEASMANGSNGESMLLVVTPQVVEEPKTGANSPSSSSAGCRAFW